MQVIANGTSPIPLGLYGMVFATYPTHKGDQFQPMTAHDFRNLVRGPIAAVSLHFTWADIQPDPPPSLRESAAEKQGIRGHGTYGDDEFTSAPLDAFLASLDSACVAEGRLDGCLPVFLKPYFAFEPAWTYTGPAAANSSAPEMATNVLGMRVVLQPRAWNPYEGPVVPNTTIPVSTDPAWHRQVSRMTAFVDGWLSTADPQCTRIPVLHFIPPVMTSVRTTPSSHILLI